MTAALLVTNTPDTEKTPRLFTAAEYDSLAYGKPDGWNFVRKPDPRAVHDSVPILNTWGTVIGYNTGWRIPVSTQTNTFGVSTTSVAPLPMYYTADPAPLGGWKTQPTMSGVIPPAWYPKRTLTGGALNATNLNPYPGTARPVMIFRIKMPWGEYGYWVPPIWLLNEGWQSLSVPGAVALGGVPLSAPWRQPTTGPTQTVNKAGAADQRGYLFAYDPSDEIPTGIQSGSYRPGQNVGKENWQGAIMAVGFITAFVGGAILLGADVGLGAAGVGAAGGGAGGASEGGAIGGTAAGIDISADVPAFSNVATVADSADLYAVAAGAEAVSAGAPVVAADVDLYAVAAGAGAVTSGAPVVTTGVSIGSNIATAAGTIGGKLLTAVEGLAVSTGVGAAAKAVGLTPKKTAMTNTPKSTPPPLLLISGGSNTTASFSSTTGGQLTIAIISGLIVILLAKVFLT